MFILKYIYYFFAAANVRFFIVKKLHHVFFLSLSLHPILSNMEDVYLFNIHVIYYLIGLAVLLPRIPVVGKFFNIINTLVHEFGHTFVALITNGQVKQIQVFNDTSGVTQTKSKSAFANFLISIAGYPFASVTAYLCFYLLSVGYEQWIVIGLSILFLFMLILWIRNKYGLLWVLLFVGLNGFLIYLNEPKYLLVAAWFYALMLLWESVYSSLVLLYLSIRRSDVAGDATNLHKMTHVPAFFWALLFAAFAGFMAYKASVLPGSLVDVIGL